jgi:drug/metabolite transporter (DMT)-like permease
MEMIIGGLGCLAISGVLGEWSQFDAAKITTPSLLGLGYLIVFGSLVGFASYTWLLRAAPTTLVSTYAYVNPVVALLVGAIIGNEVISGQMLLAAVIILASVALITSTRQPKGQAAEAAASD